MVKEYLEESLVKEIQFNVYAGSSMDFSKIDEREFDLIISNFPLPEIFKKPTIVVNTLPR